MQTVSALSVSPNTFSSTTPHNSWFNEHFRITPDNTTDISIYYSSPFSINFSETSISGLSTYRDIDFSIQIPKHFKDGSYDSKIFIEGENQTEQIDVMLTVPEDKSFTLSNTSFNISIDVGEVKYVSFSIHGDGNSPFLLKIKNNTVDFLLLPKNITIYPSLTQNIFATIRPTHTVGNFTSNILFNETKQTWRIEVIDTEPPEILEVLVPDDIMAAKDFRVHVRVGDNTEVDNVWLKIDNQSYKMDRKLIFYSENLNLRLVGNHTLYIMANDTYGNEIAKEIKITLQPYDEYIVSDFTYLQISANSSYISEVFKSDIEVPISISLENISFLPTESNQQSNYVMFYDVYNRRKEIEENTTYDLHKTDRFSLGFAGVGYGYYKGAVKVLLPDWMGSDKLVDFSIRVAESDLPSEHKDKFGDIELECVLNDTAYAQNDPLPFICLTKYPKNTDIEEVGIFLTPDMRDVLESTWKDDYEGEENLRKQVELERTIVLVLFMVMLVIVLIKIFLIDKGFRLKLR